MFKPAVVFPLLSLRWACMPTSVNGSPRSPGRQGPAWMTGYHCRSSIQQCIPPAWFFCNAAARAILLCLCLYALLYSHRTAPLCAAAARQIGAGVVAGGCLPEFLKRCELTAASATRVHDALYTAADYSLLRTGVRERAIHGDEFRREGVHRAS